MAALFEQPEPPAPAIPRLPAASSQGWDPRWADPAGAADEPWPQGGQGGQGGAEPSAVRPVAPRLPSARPRPWWTRLQLALRERLDLDRRALVGLGLLTLVATGYAVQHFWWGRPEPVAVPAQVGGAGASAAVPDAGAVGDPADSGPGADSDADTGPPAAASSGAGAGAAAGASRSAGVVVVDVAGKVAHPGVLTLPAGSRVADALRAAGGVVPGTDTTAVNLARPLVDGEEVVVGLPGAAVGAGAAGTVSGPAAPVSLNSATAEQLDALPGVGPVLAQRILQYRAEHGGFTSVDQLRDVPGLGDRKFADLRNRVRP